MNQQEWEEQALRTAEKIEAMLPEKDWKVCDMELVSLARALKRERATITDREQKLRDSVQWVVNISTSLNLKGYTVRAITAILNAGLRGLDPGYPDLAKYKPIPKPDGRCKQCGGLGKWTEDRYDRHAEQFKQVLVTCDDPIHRAATGPGS